LTTAELSHAKTVPPASPSRCLEDESLRTAALARLRSSGYAGLRRLRCEVRDAAIIVHGVVPSYYLKQVAQAVILRLDGIRSVTNLVEVRGTGRVQPGDEEVPTDPFTRDHCDGA
jgi:hypothetical protein